MKRKYLIKTILASIFCLMLMPFNLLAQEEKPDDAKKVNVGTSFFGGASDLSDGNLEIRTTETGYLDYDEEHGFIYSSERTKVKYGKYTLDADSVIFDTRLKEAQANGNVILVSEKDTIYADSMIYNFQKETGSAKGVYGQHSDLYFSGPAFDRLSQSEALFRKDTITQCDFKIPHYKIKAKEFILLVNDRIFARNAVLYVRGIPCLYLPAYSQSISEESPWQVVVGYSSELGAFSRVAYHIKNKKEVPNPITGNIETASKSRLVLAADWFANAGVGYGLDYTYGFNYNKHKGEIDLYTIGSDYSGDDDAEDDDMTFTDGTWGSDDDESSNRYKVDIKHRSQLTDDLVWTLFADVVSDPSMYTDFFNNFGTERGKIDERRVFTALTTTKDNFVFRVLFELKERLGRDRLSDPTEPMDDDLDYELDTSEEFDDSRYGNVSQKTPQINFTTRYLNIGQSKWYYNLDVNALNNLYSGLNRMSEDDDAFVRGFDIYQSVMRQVKFSERYTLLTKFGVGFGFFDFDAEPDIYNSGTSFTDSNSDGFAETVDGLTFVDEDTFLIGTEEKSFSDISNGFVYADAKMRFTARFTDYLTGTLQYRFRQGNEDDLGNFLDSIGDVESRGDLYNFRLNEHWLEGDLTYTLKNPDITISANAGHNLQSDIYANEVLDYMGTSATYKNEAKTLTITPSTYYMLRQIRDTSDEYAYERGEISSGVEAKYQPIHNRWYTGGKFSFVNVIDIDPLYDPDNYDDDEDFDDNEDEIFTEFYYGKRVGTKWLVEYRGRFDQDGGQRQQIMLARDLHDWLAELVLAQETDDNATEDDDDDDEDDSSEDNNIEFAFKISMKKPNEEVTPTNLQISTVLTEEKQAEMEEDGI